jgi:hypothetical protein
MTPFEINLLLHFHCCAGPWPRKDAPIYRPTVDKMFSDGLIEQSSLPDTDYQTTARGKAMVAHLCMVDLPVIKWVQPARTNSAAD